jgi:hypothetical protein
MAPKKRTVSTSDSDSGPDDRAPVKKVRIADPGNFVRTGRGGGLGVSFGFRT